MTRETFLNLIALGTVPAFLGGCAEYEAPHVLGEKIYRNVRFASPGGHDLHLDLYVPPTATPPPLVIWIFGGSWAIGNKAYHLNVRDLTRYGIAVAAIQYRLSGVARYPAQIDDCRTALHWLRENAPHYGIDPARIGVSGESAGGHLAALLGTTEGKDSIRAVFAMYVPSDLVSLGRRYENPKEPTKIDLLLGGPIEQKLPLAREASPINHVSASSPPFLIMAGALDKLVPLSQDEELNRRLQHAGVESRLIVVPDKEHWFRMNDAQVKIVANFFLRHFATVAR